MDQNAGEKQEDNTPDQNDGSDGSDEKEDKKAAKTFEEAWEQIKKV